MSYDLEAWRHPEIVLRAHKPPKFFVLGVLSTWISVTSLSMTGFNRIRQDSLHFTIYAVTDASAHGPAALKQLTACTFFFNWCSHFDSWRVKLKSNGLKTSTQQKIVCPVLCARSAWWCLKSHVKKMKRKNGGKYNRECEITTKKRCENCTTWDDRVFSRVAVFPDPNCLLKRDWCCMRCKKSCHANRKTCFRHAFVNEKHFAMQF